MLDDEEYEQRVHRLIEDARQFSNDELSSGREKALNYMRGETDVGNAPKGRSNIVSTKMRDACYKLTEKLMEIFGTGEPVVKFVGVSDEDAEIAKQMTAHFQYELMTRNDGWREMHDTFRSGLESSVSGMKVVWDESIEVWEEELTDVSDQELFQYTVDESIEIVEQETEEEQTMFPLEVGNGIVIQLPGPTEVKHSLKIRHKGARNQLKITGIPPEELIFDRRATKPQTARILGQDMLRPRDDLHEIGIDDDFIDAFGGGRASGVSADYQDQEKSARVGYQIDEDEGSGEETELFRITEAWVRIDRDEDGIAEWRHVITLGDNDHVWLDEMARWPQIVLCAPYLRPFSVKGDSLLDLTKDIADADTVIERSKLDNLELSNNPRLVGVRGRFNAASFLNLPPGAMGIEYQPGMVRSLELPYMAAQSLPIQEDLNRRLYTRLGINPSGLGLDPDALQSQSEFSQREQWSQGQGGILMNARNIAETTMKPLARLVAKLYAHHQNEAETVRLNGQVIDITPTQFDTDMDLTARVGLGYGDKEQRMGALLWTMGKQEAAIASDGEDNAICDTQMLVNAYDKFLKINGIEDEAEFFKNPPEEPQQDPDPAQAAIQAAQAEAQIKGQIEIQKAQIQAQTDLQEAQIKAQADIQAAIIQAQAKLAEAQGGNAVDQMQAMLKAQLQAREQDLETAIEIRGQNIEAAKEIELKQRELSSAQ